MDAAHFDTFDEWKMKCDYEGKNFKEEKYNLKILNLPKFCFASGMTLRMWRWMDTLGPTQKRKNQVLPPDAFVLRKSHLIIG